MELSDGPLLRVALGRGGEGHAGGDDLPDAHRGGDDGQDQDRGDQSAVIGGDGVAHCAVLISLPTSEGEFLQAVSDASTAVDEKPDEVADPGDDGEDATDQAGTPEGEHRGDDEQEDDSPRVAQTVTASEIDRLSWSSNERCSR